MTWSEYIALGALGLGVVNFGWLLYKHFTDGRVRLLCRVSVGASVTNRDGYVEILLINRSRRPVVLDEPKVWTRGPSLDEMSDVDHKAKVAGQEAEFKARGWPTAPLQSKFSAFHGEGTRMEIPAFDLLKREIPFPVGDHDRWPKDRAGVRVCLRDGRHRAFTWAEIDAPPTWRRWLSPATYFGWIVLTR